MLFSTLLSRLCKRKKIGLNENELSSKTEEGRSWAWRLENGIKLVPKTPQREERPRSGSERPQRCFLIWCRRLLISRSSVKPPCATKSRTAQTEERERACVQ